MINKTVEFSQKFNEEYKGNCHLIDRPLSDLQVFQLQIVSRLRRIEGLKKELNNIISSKKSNKIMELIKQCFCDFSLATVCNTSSCISYPRNFVSQEIIRIAVEIGYTLNISPILLLTGHDEVKDECWSYNLSSWEGWQEYINQDSSDAVNKDLKLGAKKVTDFFEQVMVIGIDEDENEDKDENGDENKAEHKSNVKPTFNLINKQQIKSPDGIKRFSEQRIIQLFGQCCTNGKVYKTCVKDDHPFMQTIVKSHRAYLAIVANVEDLKKIRANDMSLKTLFTNLKDALISGGVRGAGTENYATLQALYAIFRFKDLWEKYFKKEFERITTDNPAILTRCNQYFLGDSILDFIDKALHDGTCITEKARLIAAFLQDEYLLKSLNINFNESERKVSLIGELENKQRLLIKEIQKIPDSEIKVTQSIDLYFLFSAGTDKKCSWVQFLSLVDKISIDDLTSFVTRDDFKNNINCIKPLESVDIEYCSDIYIYLLIVEPVRLSIILDAMKKTVLSQLEDILKTTFGYTKKKLVSKKLASMIINQINDPKVSDQSKEAHMNNLFILCPTKDIDIFAENYFQLKVPKFKKCYIDKIRANNSFSIVNGIIEYIKTKTNELRKYDDRITKREENNVQVLKEHLSSDEFAELENKIVEGEFSLYRSVAKFYQLLSNNENKKKYILTLMKSDKNALSTVLTCSKTCCEQLLEILGDEYFSTLMKMVFDGLVHLGGNFNQLYQLLSTKLKHKYALVLTKLNNKKLFDLLQYNEIDLKELKKYSPSDEHFNQFINLIINKSACLGRNHSQFCELLSEQQKQIYIGKLMKLNEFQLRLFLKKNTINLHVMKKSLDKNFDSLLVDMFIKENISCEDIMIVSLYKQLSSELQDKLFTSLQKDEYRRRYSTKHILSDLSSFLLSNDQRKDINHTLFLMKDAFKKAHYLQLVKNILSFEMIGTFAQLTPNVFNELAKVIMDLKIDLKQKSGEFQSILSNDKQEKYIKIIMEDSEPGRLKLINLLQDQKTSFVRLKAALSSECFNELVNIIISEEIGLKYNSYSFYKLLPDDNKKKYMLIMMKFNHCKQQLRHFFSDNNICFKELKENIGSDIFDNLVKIIIEKDIDWTGDESKFHQELLDNNKGELLLTVSQYRLKRFLSDKNICFKKLKDKIKPDIFNRLVKIIVEKNINWSGDKSKFHQELLDNNKGELLLTVSQYRLECFLSDENICFKKLKDKIKPDIFNWLVDKIIEKNIYLDENDSIEFYQIISNDNKEKYLLSMAKKENPKNFLDKVSGIVAKLENMNDKLLLFNSIEEDQLIKIFKEDPLYFVNVFNDILSLKPSDDSGQSSIHSKFEMLLQQSKEITVNSCCAIFNQLESYTARRTLLRKISSLNQSRRGYCYRLYHYRSGNKTKKADISGVTPIGHSTTKDNKKHALREITVNKQSNDGPDYTYWLSYENESISEDWQSKEFMEKKVLADAGKKDLYLDSPDKKQFNEFCKVISAGASGQKEDEMAQLMAILVTINCRLVNHGFASIASIDLCKIIIRCAFCERHAWRKNDNHCTKTGQNIIAQLNKSDAKPELTNLGNMIRSELKLDKNEEFTGKHLKEFSTNNMLLGSVSKEYMSFFHGGNKNNLYGKMNKSIDSLIECIDPRCDIIIS